MAPVKDSQNRARFLGRAKELQEIRQRLEKGTRLLSLLGPPGVGKTALAVEYAQVWSNGAWVCDARRAEAAAPLSTTLGTSLGLSDCSDERLAAALNDRGPALIVICGYEHLVPKANALLQGWLEAAPQAQFLIASRRRLELDGEVVLELGPLARQDSVALYHDRASAARADYQRSPEHDDAVGELVSQLGDLPLAIVLAAARARSIGPAQLLEKLGTRLDLLTDGTTSLRGAIDDSWNALDDSQRDALGRLSIFLGGFSLEAAEALLSRPAPATEVLDILQELRDRSLVTWREVGAATPRARFELDHNIREYADQHQQASAQHPACEQRATAYFVGLAQGCLATGDYAQLELDKQNLGAALGRAQGPERARLALALARTHTDPNELRTCHAALDEVAAGLEDTDALHGELALARGELRWRLNLFGAARTDFQTAIETARSRGDDALLAASLLEQGGALFDGDERVEAGELFDEAVQAAQRCGHAVPEARAHIGLARVARNDPDAAREHLEAALSLLAREPTTIYSAAATLQLGTLSLRLGRLGQARKQLTLAWSTFRSLGNSSGEAEAQTALAVIDQEEGDLGAAITRYASSVALLGANGDLAREAESLVRQGTCLAEQGLIDAARECFQEAHAGFRLVSNSQGMCAVRGHLGVLEANLGRLDAAERAFIEAESGGVHSLPNRAVLQVQRGHLDLARGDHDTAAARYRAARAAQDGGGWTLSHRSQTLRSTLRQLERALDAPTSAPPASPAQDVIAVATTGRWFRAPGQKRVDLGRRGGLRRLLCALADRRCEHSDHAPAAALTRDELLAIGWPGERVQPEAGARRVHTALWTLRKLGLRDFLISRDDGYLLDARVPLLRVEE